MFDEAVTSHSMGNRSHVVILGAAASRAAFPNGDANGRMIPVTNDHVIATGIGGMLQEAGMDSIGNFDEIYDALSGRPDRSEIVSPVERRVRSDFTNGDRAPSIEVVAIAQTATPVLKLISLLSAYSARGAPAA
jgi:hypothetical protein